MWLRLGVLLGGRLVDERVVARREHVTLGRSPRNRLAVPSEALPRRHRLFEARRDGWTLRLADGMAARVADGDRLALHAGAVAIALGPGTRGRVTIGDVVVLFQLLRAPASRPRPQLPPSVRRSMLRSIDWLLAMLVLGSFAIHFGCVGYLSTLDFPRARDLEVVPPSLPVFSTRLVLPHAAPPAPSAKPAPGATTPRPTAAPARAPIDRRPLAERVRDQGALKILIARGKDGSLLDRLTHGDASANADEVFARISGVSSTASADRLLPHGIVAGRLAQGHGLYAGGPGEVATDARDEERRVELKDSTPTEIDGEAPPDPAAIAREVKTRLGAIRACYERALRSGALAGKLTLRFEVSALGRVLRIAVDDDTLRSPAVIDCIRERALGWHLPPARAGFAFSYPFVFVAR